jgi:anti-sigma regulatory factor (Ser/Thr protein kinase)
MKASEKIVLSVPPDLKFTSTVENFVDVILPHFNAKDSISLANQLRSTLNEAFVNVIHHSSESLCELVEITFEFDKQQLLIQFRDKGKGIKIQGHFPPYPDDFKNTTHKILETIDGEVIAYVEDSNTLQLNFNEYKVDEIDPQKLVEKAKEGGMGLSLIVKLMDCVRFVFETGKGNCLEITKILEIER